MMKISEIENGLESAGYIPTRQISYAVSTAVDFGTPIFLEGPAGVGKTQLARSTADMLGVPLIRAQFYEGLTSDQLLYDYDYQKQLLSIQAISQSLGDNLNGKSISEALDAVADIDFYSESFLIPRPLLRSITEGRCVLLLDEVDKASEEIEYALLEFLENYSMSIPQLGRTVECPVENRPIVFLTSNRYRELSDALKRRCAYLYIPDKTESEMLDILKKKSSASADILVAVSNAIVSMRQAPMKKAPSVAEAVAWADRLEFSLDDENVSVEESLSLIVKDDSDLRYVLEHPALFSALSDVYAKCQFERLGLEEAN